MEIVFYHIIETLELSVGISCRSSQDGAEIENELFQSI